MAATQDSRRAVVGPDGTIFYVTKEPDEKFIITVDFTDWLGGATTVVSCAAPVALPVDVTNAPTLVAGTVTGTTVPITLDAGTAIWNVNGQGTASALVTMANGEKKEINFIIHIQEV